MTERRRKRGGMKERPILFSGPMVQAINEGRKTQTRRVIKNLDGIYRLIEENYSEAEYYKAFVQDEYGDYHDMPCPYGKPGDRLWVRERWAVAECYDNLSPSQLILTMRQVEYAADGTNYLSKVRGRWRSPIHMPRWASRITLEIIGVRVERLQDISEEGAIAEGSQIPCDQLPKSCRQGCLSEREQFARIWNVINGNKHPWESNPFVWVIEFKVK